MAEDKKQTDKIIPQITKSEKAQVLPPAFSAAPGKVHIVRVDPGGNDIPGSDFQIGEFNARSYRNNPAYRIVNEPTKKK